MAGGKTLGMIRSLQEKEKGLFRETIENKRNGSLLRLFNLLAAIPSDGKEPTQTELFVTIKGEVWEPEKDYILRNELRHLNRFLKEFIAQQQQSVSVSDFADALTLLAELGTRAEWKLFDIEFAALERKALEIDDPEVVAHAWRIHTEFLGKRTAVDEKDTLRVLEQIRQSQFWQRRAAVRIQLSEWQRYEYYQRILHSLRYEEYAGTPPPLEGLQVSDLGPWDHYLLLKGAFYSVNQEERLVKLKEIEELLPRIVGGKLHIEKEKLWLYAAIGLEYYLARDYANARITLSRALIHPDFTDHPKRIAICFNYLAVLLKDRDYLAALEKMLEWDALLSANPHITDRYRCQKGMIFLFNGQLDAALETLQDHVSHTNPDTYLYYRLMLAIVHYQRKNLVSATNEIENIQQSTIIRKGDFGYYKTIAKFLERLFMAIEQSDTVGVVQTNTTLLGILETIEGEGMEQIQDILLTQWVVDEIGRLQGAGSTMNREKTY